MTLVLIVTYMIFLLTTCIETGIFGKTVKLSPSEGFQYCFPLPGRLGHVLVTKGGSHLWIF